MNLGEPIFIFILAFILLGPKRTSDLARQVGKLMAEFRKASNDFKYQFNEEMRVADQQELQKKQESERAALAAAPPAAGLLASDGSAGVPSLANADGLIEGSVGGLFKENTILPPAGHEAEAKAEEAVPYAISAISATTGEEHPIEDHPLLRVDVIPPMDGTPMQSAISNVPPGLTPAEDLAPETKTLPEHEKTQDATHEDKPVHHG